jgi:tRNA A37 threonylcarbamoyladenosine modification protein TsaB
MLLALDTASTTASVAVYDPDRSMLLGEITWEGRRRQTQNLMPQVRQLLATVGVSVEDQLKALAVTTGTGQFCGGSDRPERCQGDWAGVGDGAGQRSGCRPWR